MSKLRWLALGALSLGTGMMVTAMGCSGSSSDEDATGVAQIAITQVPLDGSVGCIAVTATGAFSVTKSTDVAPGTNSVLNLNGLPTGTVSFVGNAYAGPCAQVGPASVPTWISDPALASISNVPVVVTLVMKQNGNATVGVDFPGASCRTSGQPCFSGSECCSNVCVNNACQSSCQGTGSACMTNADCCAGNSCLGGVCQPGCQPISCAQYGFNCGLAPDGCGGVMDCGSCPAGLICGGGGLPNQCAPGGCFPPGFPCTSNAGCCNGSCIAGICQPGCQPITCQQLGFTCGLTGDGCGGLIDCGTCPAGQTCGGGGQPNMCSGGCAPGFASCNGACIDLNTDPFNCGLCGLYCGPGAVCSNGVCLAGPPMCNDGIKNGAETDVDCGGNCAPCPVGKVCIVAPDCVTGSCQNNICQAPSCSDGVKNGTETDVDCGGVCGLCLDGQMCVIDSNCLNSLCLNGICHGPSCADGIKDGTETDVDCGGPTCVPCGPGRSCAANVDCVTGLCVNQICQ